MSDCKILLVDDSETERYLQRRSLSRAAGTTLDLHEADNAIKAIERLREHRYDAVFLDIRMPGDDGFYVLEQLRAAEASSWPLVIIWSSSIHPDDVAKSYGHCANLCLRKPDSLDDMLDVTSRCLSIIEVCARPSNGRPRVPF